MTTTCRPTWLSIKTHLKTKLRSQDEHIFDNTFPSKGTFVHFIFHHCLLGQARPPPTHILDLSTPSWPLLCHGMPGQFHVIYLAHPAGWVCSLQDVKGAGFELCVWWMEVWLWLPTLLEPQPSSPSPPCGLATEYHTLDRWHPPVAMNRHTNRNENLNKIARMHNGQQVRNRSHHHVSSNFNLK